MDPLVEDQRLGVLLHGLGIQPALRGRVLSQVLTTNPHVPGRSIHVGRDSQAALAGRV